MQQWKDYCERGFTRFAYDERLAAWIDGVTAAAEATTLDKNHHQWWRCNGTWFVGVNVLENDARGQQGDSLPLQGEAFDFIDKHIHLSHAHGAIVLDRAQISVCTEGYPQQGENESDAAHKFRLERDAAHLDGLLKEMPQHDCASRNVHSDAPKRYLKEQHGFILGIGMRNVPTHAAPFVIYEESHKIVQAWLKERLQNIAPEKWSEEDLTAEYKVVRQTVFDNCRRTELPLNKGEAFLVHRFAIHGTAPWKASAHAPRMLAFFRPPITVPKQEWLES